MKKLYIVHDDKFNIYGVTNSEIKSHMLKQVVKERLYLLDEVETKVFISTAPYYKVKEMSEVFDTPDLYI